MNQQLHPPSQSDPLLHDLCRTPFSWNGAWRSRFGKSKRLSEMHLATISPHPRSPSPSPPFPLPRLQHPWWPWRNFLQNVGRCRFSLTFANLILSPLQKGREGWAALLGLRGFGDADGRPWQTDLSQSKVIVRSMWSWILLEFLRKCKAIFLDWR